MEKIVFGKIMRRQFVEGAVLAAAAALAACQSRPASAVPPSNKPNQGSVMQLEQAWDKTFARSDKVDHRKVTFKNRYGITLAADVYLPKDRAGQRLAAL